VRISRFAERSWLVKMIIAVRIELGPAHSEGTSLLRIPALKDKAKN
jgi:hypothetical protein